MEMVDKNFFIVVVKQGEKTLLIKPFNNSKEQPAFIMEFYFFLFTSFYVEFKEICHLKKITIKFQFLKKLNAK